MIVIEIGHGRHVHGDEHGNDDGRGADFDNG